MFGCCGQVDRQKLKKDRLYFVSVFICVYICVHMCALVWRVGGQPWVPVLNSLSRGLSH